MIALILNTENFPKLLSDSSLDKSMDFFNSCASEKTSVKHNQN